MTRSSSFEMRYATRKRTYLRSGHRTHLTRILLLCRSLRYTLPFAAHTLMLASSICALNSPTSTGSYSAFEIGRAHV